MEKRDVENVAEMINTISNNYHLSHATHACERFHQILYKAYSKERNEKLSKEIKEALNRKDKERIDVLLKNIEQEEINISPRRIRIYIDYISVLSENAGRVTYIDGKYIINLPESLMLSVVNENSSYNIEAVNKLRKAMAHELGHIALHFGKLYNVNDLRGSLFLEDDCENEADWFAEKLLELRRKRNQKLHDDGIII